MTELYALPKQPQLSLPYMPAENSLFAFSSTSAGEVASYDASMQPSDVPALYDSQLYRVERYREEPVPHTRDAVDLRHPISSSSRIRSSSSSSSSSSRPINTADTLFTQTHAHAYTYTYGYSDMHESVGERKRESVLMAKEHIREEGEEEKTLENMLRAVLEK